MELQDLMNYNGIGEAKAVCIPPLLNLEEEEGNRKPSYIKRLPVVKTLMITFIPILPNYRTKSFGLFY
jgi:hypothetical protein